jgi:hypothetical protein
MALPSVEQVVTVAQLRRQALEFDAVSDETGARYSAQAFVAYVAAELAGVDERLDRKRETAYAGARRRWDREAATG